MRRNRTESSCRDILILGLSEDLVPEVAREEAWRVEVDPTAEDLRELSLHVEERQTGHVSGLKLNEHINVTLGRKVLAENRAEERQPPHVVTAAERRNGISVECDSR